MSKVTHVKFPNESFYDEVPNFKLDEFIPVQFFDYDVFGYYQDVYVNVMKEDYERLLKENEEN